jgi:hypothetical protein
VRLRIHGTATLFVAVDPLAGWREVTVTDHRCRTDWAHFVKELLDGRYRDVDTVTWISSISIARPASTRPSSTRGKTPGKEEDRQMACNYGTLLK